MPGCAMWEIEYYEKPNGRCPVKEFLDSLSVRDELPYVIREIDILANFGYKLDRPHAALLREKIYELRIKSRQGNIRLLYFFYAGNKIILTNGFVKKAIKVRDSEIDKAIEYRKDYYQRNQGIKK
jgi:phage-related protein